MAYYYAFKPKAMNIACRIRSQPNFRRFSGVDAERRRELFLKSLWLAVPLGYGYGLHRGFLNAKENRNICVFDIMVFFGGFYAAAGLCYPVSMPLLVIHDVLSDKLDEHRSGRKKVCGSCAGGNK